MREIKFRAWDPMDGGYMFDPFTLNDCSDGYLCYTKLDYLKLMQFTGIKDKNGREIYEGDIVKEAWLSIERIGVICFWCGEFLGCALWAWDGDSPDDDATGNLWYFGLATQRSLPKATLEVIGNIYENPELVNNRKTGHKLDS